MPLIRLFAYENRQLDQNPNLYVLKTSIWQILKTPAGILKQISTQFRPIKL